VKYRKLPIEIEAVQYNGANLKQIKALFGEDLVYAIFDDARTPKGGKPGDTILIQTLKGTIICSIGDYMVKGVAGEFYIRKPDIFHKTYELV